MTSAFTSSSSLATATPKDLDQRDALLIVTDSSWIADAASGAGQSGRPLSSRMRRACVRRGGFGGRKGFASPVVDSESLSGINAESNGNPSHYWNRDFGSSRIRLSRKYLPMSFRICHRRIECELEPIQ